MTAAKRKRPKPLTARQQYTVIKGQMTHIRHDIKTLMRAVEALEANHLLAQQSFGQTGAQLYEINKHLKAVMLQQAVTVHKAHGLFETQAEERGTSGPPNAAAPGE